MLSQHTTYQRRNNKQGTEMLREAKREVKAKVQESYQWRDWERRERIEALTSSTVKADATEATRLRCLQKAEALKNLFDKLRRLRLAREKVGFTRLEIPATFDEDPYQCDDWQKIDVTTEILRHLRDRNRRQFGQAHGTPFTVPPLNDDLGFLGENKSAEEILNGEYSTNGLDANVSTVLKHLKQTEAIASMQKFPTITKDEFREKLKIWWETTIRTSLSGLHLRHYKALLAKHAFSFIPDDKDEDHQRERKELDCMQADLLHVHLSLLNYALRWGYSYSRWQQVANTIIFKEPGNIRIHRTRVIH